MSLSPNKKLSLHEETNGEATEIDDVQLAPDAPMNRSLPLPNELCDVCNAFGNNQNLVK